MAIKLELELQEVEAVLKHISAGIYADVAQLIAKIHGQALPQASAAIQAQVTEPVIAEPVPKQTEPQA